MNIIHTLSSWSFHKDQVILTNSFRKSFIQTLTIEFSLMGSYSCWYNDITKVNLQSCKLQCLNSQASRKIHTSSSLSLVEMRPVVVVQYSNNVSIKKSSLCFPIITNPFFSLFIFSIVASFFFFNSFGQLPFFTGNSLEHPQRWTSRHVSKERLTEYGYPRRHGEFFIADMMIDAFFLLVWGKEISAVVGRFGSTHSRRTRWWFRQIRRFQQNCTNYCENFSGL